MIAAIDPGAKGAIAILDGEEVIEICDLSKEPEKVINSVLVTYGVKVAVVEMVGVMPHDSKVASFSFGQNVGRILAACALSGAEVVRVKPRKWQTWCKIYGSGDTKKLGFALVKRVYGSEMFLGPRGGLKDGRVDALLIALWYVNNN
ncbi:putative RNaseH-like domain protein [Vibrio phage H188]|nr:putative RNaseH-like domain protein [Vibrio phage H188]